MVRGFAGFDTLYGGAGNDHIIGGDGHDVLCVERLPSGKPPQRPQEPADGGKMSASSRWGVSAMAFYETVIGWTLRIGAD